MPDNVLITSRSFPFAIQEVMGAWTDPETLSQWWGPEGFTNEFEVCDMANWGDWIFVMRGPDGTEYRNVSKWLEVAENRIVMEHTCEPRFTLRADFIETPSGTDLIWTTTFENAAFLTTMKDYLIEKNGENMDRLERILAKKRTDAAA